MTLGVFCGSAGAVSSESDANVWVSPFPGKTVVYIPLGNRPFQYERGAATAKSLNITLVMPDEDLFSTRLDGHTRNQNGTQSGNREALLTWLKAQDASCITFIPSHDQLLSGGLRRRR